MASGNTPTKDTSMPVSPPSIEPEVAQLLTNEETLCERAISLLLKVCSIVIYFIKNNIILDYKLPVNFIILCCYFSN